MEETHLVAAVAARIIGRHGSKSLDTIAEYCEMASAIGDRASLQTWLDIAAAVRLLQSVPADAQGSAGATDVVFSLGHRDSLQPTVLADIPG